MIRRVAFVAALISLVHAPTALARPDPTEMSLGDRVYQEMVSNHYLMPNSPEAKLLAPVAKQLKTVGDSAYGAPFTFYVHVSTVPNAFYVYGPRVYVNRGLIRMADSQEELAGVLCHEMSHALHRDGSNDDQGAQAYDARTKRLIAQSEAMTHGHLGQPISGLAQYGENFVWLHHSRKQEERADLAGADLCAAAKFNPWGMVWMFQKLERVAGSGGFAWFSDHPDTKTRIAALKHHFRQYPAVFVSFNSDEITATPLWMGVVQAPAPQQDSWGFLSLERRMKQARRAVVGLGQIPLLRLQLHSISGEGSS